MRSRHVVGCYDVFLLEQTGVSFAEECHRGHRHSSPRSATERMEVKESESGDIHRESGHTGSVGEEDVGKKEDSDEFVRNFSGSINN